MNKYWNIKNIPNILLFFCIGNIISFFSPQTPSLLILGILILFSATFAVYFRHKSWSIHLLLIAVIFSGCLYASFRTQLAMQNRISINQINVETKIKIKIISQPEMQEKRTRFLARVIDGDNKGQRLLLSDYSNQNWHKGEIWQIKTKLKAPIGMLNSVGFNSEAWALSHRIDGFGNIRKERTLIKNSIFRLPEIRYLIEQRIYKVANQYTNGAAIISALTIGKTQGLTNQHWQQFRHLGINHLVSISGLHIGTVATTTTLLLLFILKQIIWRKHFSLPENSWFWNPKIVAMLGGLLVATIYAFLAGFSIPTQRSLIMVAATILALCFKRFLTIWQIWTIALFAVLLFDPLAVLTTGFWLSFGLIAALIIMSANLKRNKVSSKRLFFETQLAATLASIVPVGVFFAAIPLLSPIVNIFAIPIFSLILVPLSLLSLLLPFDGLLWLSIFLAEKTLDIIVWVDKFALMLPITHNPIIWTVFAIIATIIFLLPKGFGLRLWAIVILITWILFPSFRLPENQFRATIYDVGQGTSVLFQTKNHNLLFDTGRPNVEQSLISSLYADGIRKLDKLVLSHNDADHDGNADAIINTFHPSQILSGVPSYYEFNSEFCNQPISWQWDKVVFEFLAIPKNEPEYQSDKNDASCVLRVIAQGQAFLITGDLSSQYENELVKQYQDSLYSQILVLGHHGSKTSSSENFLDAVSPQYAIISNGFMNAYNHPHNVVMRRIERREIKTFRTDFQGALIFDVNDNIKAYPKNTKYLLELKRGRIIRAYWQQKPKAN